MPPAPRPEDHAPFADLNAVRSGESDENSTLEKKESPTQPFSPPKSDYPSALDFIRTGGMALAMGYTLDHFGLIESHYWLSVFAIANTMEVFGPPVHNFVQYVFPVFLMVKSMILGVYPSYFQVAMYIPSYLILVGIPMSVCLHRYFSHAAFETTRAMQLVLAIVSTFAYQGGALWWSAKHVRHHHHCDQPEDPHSVVQKGYFYAFVGWTMNPAETTERNYKFNNPKLFVPELLFLDKFYHLPSIILFAALESCGVSRSFITWSLLSPMLVCRLVTLLFNVEYHPAHDARRCKSIDQPQLLADLVGESYHEIHHRKPAQSKRSNLDLPYWLTLFWMERVGLVWNCR